MNSSEIVGSSLVAESIIVIDHTGTMEPSGIVESSEIAEVSVDTLEVVESSDIEKKKKPRGVKWLDDEVRVLFLSKKNRNVNLRTATRGHPIYRELSNDMLMAGYTRSPYEIRNKVENMYNQYRREKELLEMSGASCSKWKYYEIMKRILELDEMADPLPDYSPDSDTKGKGSAHIVKLSTSVVGNDAASDSDCVHPDKPTPDSPPQASLPHVNGISHNTSSPRAPQVPIRTRPLRKILPKKREFTQAASAGEEEEGHPAAISNSHTKKRKRDAQDILEGLLQEFRRANTQNERLDRELIDLLKQGNELCRKQNELLTQLLNK